MKNIVFVTIIILILTIVSLSGCQDFFSDIGSTTYESYPIKIRYTLSYGYKINCSGTGNYNINYNCDLPDEIFNVQILSTIVFNNNYEDKILASHNSMKIWNITSGLTKNYDLGITTTVQSESYVVSDLNGANALSVQEINNRFPSFVKQYCQSQSKDITVYIDPNNPNIKMIASELLKNANTNNAFLVAKELFKWLKQQTYYQTHIESYNVQPASVTLQCKTGDCDDLSYLYISLCRSIGIPSRFIRGFLIEENNATPHVWVEVFVGGDIGDNGWLPVECAGLSNNAKTEVHQNFGLENADHIRLFKDDGSNESLNISLSGLTYLTYGIRNIEVNSFSDVRDYVVLQSNELKIDKNGFREYI